MDEPYSNENCEPAFQLRWSLAVFANRSLPPAAQWSSELSTRLEPDGVRVLECMLSDEQAAMFLLSTVPSVAPAQIVKSVKGRLQHLLRDDIPKALRRNFFLASVGNANLDALDSYVGNQLSHHQMADQRVQMMLEEFQFADPDVDLSRPIASNSGLYICNLHLALVNVDRWHEINRSQLQLTYQTLHSVASEEGHRLARASLNCDHLHSVFGFNYLQSPEQVALKYMNEIAKSHQCPYLQYSYYVGTVGPYDMNAVRNRTS